MPGGSSLTECGLPGIREIPYGLHMCHFYEDRDALAATLVPYLAAGLRRNERCLLVAAEPLRAAAALRALQDAGVDAHAAQRKGALVLHDFSGWYLDSGLPRGEEVVGTWLEEERRALAEGYDGLRITGNTSFLNRAAWPAFMDYEEAVTRAFQGRRIVTLCSYHAARCGATDVLDVVRRHDCTLERPDQGWQILPRPPA